MKNYIFRLFVICHFIPFQIQAQLNSEQLVRVHNFSNENELLDSVASPLRGNLACSQNDFFYFDGTQWRTVWNTLGNDNIGTNDFLGTTNDVFLKFHTNNLERMVIGHGRVGINISNPAYQFHINGENASTINDDFIVTNGGNVGIGIVPTERLHVNGNIFANGSITPDYVFEHYFDGSSEINPNYKFSTLEEVEEFVKKHKHLPGVPSAKEVKLQGGILVNKATEINLEKIEELHLHLFELYEEKNEIEIQLVELEKRIE